MKKISLLVIASAISVSTFAQEAAKKEKVNTFEIHAKGLANSTWLFNNNISNTGDSQDYDMGWGFNYGLGFTAYFGNVGFGIEGLMGNHKAAFTGKLETKVGGVVLNTTDYTSSINLSTIQVPLMFKLKSTGGAYLEVGAQYNMISAADYKRTGNYMNADTAISASVTKNFASSYFSGVLGFGAAIPFGEESPMAILVGMRLQYSFTDLKGVDALGQDLSDSFIYNKYEATSAASGGLTLGFVYKIGGKKK